MVNAPKPACSKVGKEAVLEAAAAELSAGEEDGAASDELREGALWLWTGALI